MNGRLPTIVLETNAKGQEFGKHNYAKEGPQAHDQEWVPSAPGYLTKLDFYVIHPYNVNTS
jgi:hypothetical protein